MLMSYRGTYKTRGLEANCSGCCILSNFSPYLSFLAVGLFKSIAEVSTLSLLLLIPKLKELPFACDGIAISTATRQDVTDSEV